MPDSRPPAGDMLDALVLFFERDILPDLHGAKRFHCRVAVNVMKILGRELRDGPALDAAERQRLLVLLEDAGPAAAGDDTTALNHLLAARIRSGAQEPFDPVLIDHIRQTLRAALSINNPKWLD